MFWKRLFRLLGDLLDIIGRYETVWSLVKFTKAGHLIAAGAVGLGIFIVAVAKSDRLLSAIAIALFVSVCVFGLISLLTAINNRPKLKYGGITGLQFEFGTAEFGSEQGGFMYGDSFLRPLLVRIANTQQATDVSANNVRASVRYKHHDKNDRTTVKGVWLVPGRRGMEWPERLQIDSGETRLFVLIYEYPPTPNQEALNAKRTNDFLVTGDLFEGSHFKKLGVGQWKILLEVQSDNSAPLLLRGGFTITKDQNIRFDAPALRKVGTWN